MNDNKPIIEGFDELISSEIPAAELAEILDRCSWKLTQYILNDPGFVGHLDADEPISYLRKLRDVLLARKPNA